MPYVYVLKAILLTNNISAADKGTYATCNATVISIFIGDFILLAHIFPTVCTFIRALVVEDR